MTHYTKPPLKGEVLPPKVGAEGFVVCCVGL